MRGPMRQQGYFLSFSKPNSLRENGNRMDGPLLNFDVVGTSNRLKRRQRVNVSEQRFIRRFIPTWQLMLR